MIKAFVVAMLAVGAALLLIALFVPDRPQPTSQRHQHFVPIAAKIDTAEVEQADERRRLPTTPPRLATHTMPPAAISIPPSTNNTSYSPPSANKPALSLHPTNP